MSQHSENRIRVFADAVTIDAWHEEFSAKSPTADLHADIVFGTARIGGEAESPIRFRLSVKRAEVIAVIPPFEPVSVDRKSVSRDSPDQKGRMTSVVEKSSRAHAKGNLTASVSQSGLKGAASVEAGVQGTVSASKKIEISGKIQFMAVTQSKTPEGYYRWTVEPTAAPLLEGRPWDPIKHPRLKLIDERKDRSRGIPPTIRIEVRCRREDLIIDDLQIKDESLWDSVKARAGFKNRMAAAESYIRDRLLAEGLEVNNIHDVFGTITLGSVIAES